VAANAKMASTKTGGDIFLQLIFNIGNPGVHTDRVLNGPTNDVWINPWLHYLMEKGVKYHFGCTGLDVQMKGGKVAGITIFKQETGEEFTATGDYYILATPVEVAAKLINPDMLKADPTLANVQELATSVAWMNGLHFIFPKRLSLCVATAFMPTASGHLRQSRNCLSGRPMTYKAGAAET
jgi:hypothetical protein